MKEHFTDRQQSINSHQTFLDQSSTEGGKLASTLDEWYQADQASEGSSTDLNGSGARGGKDSMDVDGQENGGEDGKGGQGGDEGGENETQAEKDARKSNAPVPIGGLTGSWLTTSLGSGADVKKVVS